MIRRFLPLILAALALAVEPTDAFAQMEDAPIMLPTDISIHDLGWGQLGNLDEIAEFVLAVVETIVFVSAFAFHPRANALRTDARGWVVQSSMFLFGLIGMLIGFLVVHHGFLIGFVVFGIGGLFRFRMESSSLMDGAILILVTLIGLSVGMNLPVMALIATVAAWITIWFITARTVSVLELKFEDEDMLSGAMTRLRAALADKDFRIVDVKKTDFKPVIEIVLSHSNPDAGQFIPGILEELGKSGYGPKGWYVV
ncbi:hypothetical protein AB2B41_21910 [Marimonas sp. MJW-29]|uniref:DUF4956 domain-containing protein n=1 Tax=Sulfitobacter sediminis TaxID=3234186 RepID=A0ABV3RUN2_9RHOB